MYDFELKVKVPFLYEITYEEMVNEFDQRYYERERRVEKTERFADWEKLCSFAYDLKGKKILQVAEIKDMTNALRNDVAAQTFTQK